MAISVSVVDGKIQENASAGSSAEKSSSGSKLGKDAFLQLLVTQMKYQDPLEPQDNSEYIAQLATFSQLEETQNMERTLENNQAASLVGKNVMVKTTSGTTGDVAYVAGKVEYVAIENNKSYLSIDGKRYSIDQLDTVMDDEYWEAYLKANGWNSNGNTQGGQVTEKPESGETDKEDTDNIESEKPESDQTV